MDAPPEKGEDVRPFIAIAEHLRGLGLSAPEIFAADEEQGLLLLEDLGDALFARVVKGDEEDERVLYQAAAECLHVIKHAGLPVGVPKYCEEEMAEAACLALDWYRTACGPAEDLTLRSDLRALVRKSLGTISEPTLVLRDFHAENLIWLPDRSGKARVGLLDFQDAASGHNAYDLASLLIDARRDVSPKVQTIVRTRFAADLGTTSESFDRGYFACSAQRNLRIIGVFARLCIRDGKPDYPDLIPRVWRNLMSDLEHASLSELRHFVISSFSEPTPEVIAKIKSACGQGAKTHA